jgi:hypothetical protein
VGYTLKPEIICSSNALLPPCIGNISVLLGLYSLEPPWILSLKTAIAKPFFMEIIMLITWAIWTTRNDFIFKVVTSSIYRCRKKFKDDMVLIIHKEKRNLIRDYSLG